MSSRTPQDGQNEHEVAPNEVQEAPGTTRPRKTREIYRGTTRPRKTRDIYLGATRPRRNTADLPWDHRGGTGNARRARAAREQGPHARTA